MRKEMRVVSILLTILFLNFVSSSISVGIPSHNIETIYDSGEAITGWINISLIKEPTTSILKSSLGGSINLLELMGKSSNTGFIKNCDTLQCVSSYSASNPTTSRIFNLKENDTFLFGFKITSPNRLTSIYDFMFNLTSNNPETENFPLAIDVLNDGVYEWNAYKASDNFGGENRGCFGIKTGQADIAGVSYCERMRLERTPEIELGAYVQGNTPDVEFLMTIESVDGLKSESCTTTPAIGAGTIERVSCVVEDFSINKKEDYFVCIRVAHITDTNRYKINIEEDSEKCGFSSTSGGYEGSYNYDFDVFARPKKYAEGINFTLDNTELGNARSPQNDIEQYIQNYIGATYGNNCTNGCVIPMKIFSGVDQTITLKNTMGTNPYIISYVAGISTTTDKFYDVAENPALITAPFQKLYVGESGFLALLVNKNHVLDLTSSGSDGETDIFSENINVGGIPGIKSLVPLKTGVKIAQKFTVLLNSSINASKYTWDFGDGKIENTTKAENIHTYNTAKTYKLRVSILNSLGVVISFKEFDITVASAQEMVPELLTEAETNLELVKTSMANFTAFEKKAVNYTLKLSQIEKDLTRLKTSAAQASSQTTFENILGELLNMEIPVSVAKTISSGVITFYPTDTNINLDALKEIGGGEYDSTKEAEYKQAILLWDELNLNTKLVYQEIMAIYPEYEENLLRTFEITFSNSGQDAYIIMEKMDNVLFKEDYSQNEEGGYYSFDLEEEQKIVFSTTESVDFLNLPVFVSPPIEELTLQEITERDPNAEFKKWVKFGIIAAGILVAFIGTWIFLQIWYKRKYENSLFKNRNNLYNLVNYIQNERNKGTGNGEIINKLKKTGWTAEQIRYALKKHAGKKTGMPEIPLGKLLEGKKKDKDVAVKR